MNNYKYVIGLYFFLQTIAVFSQEIKIFDGEFKEGTAEYEFYTNENYDIIYSGFFRYYGEKYTAKGYYEENNPEGEWLITANNNVYSNLQSKIQTNTYVKGKYSNGLLSGLWEYKNSFLLPDWKTGEFSDEKDPDTDISEASFFNNIFVGNISFNRNFQKINITGSFNSKGLMAGTWSYKKDYEEDIIKYKNGVAYWRLIRNLPTGEKTLFIDSTAFVDEFWKNYDSVNQVSIIGEKVYYADKVQVNSEKRISNSALNLANNDIRTNRRTYDNPAIAIWQNVTVDVYQSYSATNPLYYGIRDSRSPKAYEILIKECIYSKSNNDQFISNSSCSKALNDLKQRKEIAKVNREKHSTAKKLLFTLKQKVDLIEKDSKTTRLKLESIKPIYSQNYLKCLLFLKSQFDSELNEINFSDNSPDWSNQDQRYFSSLKAIEKKIINYEMFHSKISSALKNNDKKTLKLLKKKNEIPEMISSVLNQ